MYFIDIIGLTKIENLFLLVGIFCPAGQKIPTKEEKYPAAAG
jgi:hypothetical protein